MRKCQLATHLADMPILPMIKVTTEEKVSSMYGQRYEEPSQIQEEYDPKVYGGSTEKKLHSIVNSIREQSALLLIAVRDCIVNKKSQLQRTLQIDNICHTETLQRLPPPSPLHQ